MLRTSWKSHPIYIFSSQYNIISPHLRRILSGLNVPTIQQKHALFNTARGVGGAGGTGGGGGGGL